MDIQTDLQFLKNEKGTEEILEMNEELLDMIQDEIAQKNTEEFNNFDDVEQEFQEKKKKIYQTPPKRKKSQTRQKKSSAQKRNPRFSKKQSNEKNQKAKRLFSKEKIKTNSKEYENLVFQNQQLQKKINSKIDKKMKIRSSSKRSFKENFSYDLKKNTSESKRNQSFDKPKKPRASQERFNSRKPTSKKRRDSRKKIRKMIQEQENKFKRKSFKEDGEKPFTQPKKQSKLSSENEMVKGKRMLDSFGIKSWKNEEMSWKASARDQERALFKNESRQATDSNRGRFGEGTDYGTNESDIFRRNEESLTENDKKSYRQSSSKQSEFFSKEKYSTTEKRRASSRNASSINKTKTRSSGNKRLIPMKDEVSKYEKYRSSFGKKKSRRSSTRKSRKNSKEKYKELKKRFQEHEFISTAKISSDENESANSQEMQYDQTLSNKVLEVDKQSNENESKEFSIPVEDKNELGLREYLKEILAKSDNLGIEDKIHQTEQLITALLTSNRYSDYRRHLTDHNNKIKEIQNSFCKNKLEEVTDGTSKPKSTYYSATNKQYDESYFINNELDLEEMGQENEGKERSDMSPEISRTSGMGNYREIIFSYNQMGSLNNTQSASDVKSRIRSAKEKEFSGERNLMEEINEQFDQLSKEEEKEEGIEEDEGIEEGEKSHDSEEDEFNEDVEEEYEEETSELKETHDTNEDVMVLEISEKDIRKITEIHKEMKQRKKMESNFKKLEILMNSIGQGMEVDQEELERKIQAQDEEEKREIKQIEEQEAQIKNQIKKKQKRNKSRRRREIEERKERNKMREEKKRLRLEEKERLKREEEMKEEERRELARQKQRRKNKEIKIRKKREKEERERAEREEKERIEWEKQEKIRIAKEQVEVEKILIQERERILREKFEKEIKMKKKIRQVESVNFSKKRETKRKEIGRGRQKIKSKKTRKSRSNNTTQESFESPKNNTKNDKELEFISSSRLINVKNNLFQATPHKIQKVEKLLSKMGDNKLVKYLCKKDFALNEEEKFKKLIENKPNFVDPFEELEKINYKKEQNKPQIKREFNIDYNIQNLVNEDMETLLEQYNEPTFIKKNKKVELSKKKKIKKFEQKSRAKTIQKTKKKKFIREEKSTPLYNQENKEFSKNNHDKCHTFYCKHGSEYCHKEYDKNRFKSKEEAQEYRRKRKEEIMRQIELVQERSKQKKKKEFSESKPMKLFVESIKKLNKNGTFYNLISRKNKDSFSESIRREKKTHTPEEINNFKKNTKESDQEKQTNKNLINPIYLNKVRFPVNYDDQESKTSGSEIKIQNKSKFEDLEYNNLNRKAGITSNPLKNLLFFKKPKFSSNTQTEKNENAETDEVRSVTQEDINTPEKINKRQTKKGMEILGEDSRRAKKKSKKIKRRMKNLSQKKEKKTIFFPDLMKTFGEHRDSLPEDEIRRKTLVNQMEIEQAKIREIARRFREAAIGDGDTDDESFEEIEEETEESLDDDSFDREKEAKVIENKATELLGFNEYSTKKQSVKNPVDPKEKPDSPQINEMTNSFRISNEPNSIHVEIDNNTVNSQLSKNFPRTSVFRKEKNSIGYVFERGGTMENEPDSMIAISKQGMKTFYDKEKQQQNPTDRNQRSKSVSDKNLTSLQQRKQNPKNQNMTSARDNLTRNRNKTDMPNQLFRMGSDGSFGENKTIALDPENTLKFEESIPMSHANSSLKKSRKTQNRNPANTVSVLEMSLSEIDSKMPDHISPYDLMSPNDTFHQHFEGEGFRSDEGLISKIEEEEGEIQHFVNVETFENSFKTTDRDKQDEFPPASLDSKGNLRSKRELDFRNDTFEMDDKFDGKEKVKKLDSLPEESHKEKGEKMGMSSDTEKIIKDAEMAGIDLLAEHSNKEYMKLVNDINTEQLKYSTQNSKFTADIPNKRQSGSKPADFNLDQQTRKTSVSQANKKQPISNKFKSEQNPSNTNQLAPQHNTNPHSNNVFQNDLSNYFEFPNSREISLRDTVTREMGSNVKEYALLSDISRPDRPSIQPESDKNKPRELVPSEVGGDNKKMKKSKKKSKQSIVNSEYISFEEKKDESHLRNRLTSLDGYFNDLGGEEENKNERLGVRKEIKMIQKIVDINKLKDNLFKKKENSKPKKAPIVFKEKRPKNVKENEQEVKQLDTKKNKNQGVSSQENQFIRIKENEVELKKIQEEGESLETKKERLEEQLRVLRKKSKGRQTNEEIQRLLLMISQLEKNKKKSQLLLSDLEHDIARISDVYKDNIFIKNDRARRDSKVPRIKRQSTTKNKEVVTDFYKVKNTKKISSKYASSKNDKSEKISNKNNIASNEKNKKETKIISINKNDGQIDIYRTTEQNPSNAEKSLKFDTNKQIPTNEAKFTKYKTEPEKKQPPKPKYGTEKPKRRARKPSSLWAEPRKKPKRPKKQRMEPFMKLSKKKTNSKNSMKKSMISLNQSVASKKRDSIIQKSREVLGKHDNYFEMKSVNTSVERKGSIKKSKTETSLKLLPENTPSISEIGDAEPEQYNFLSPQSSHNNLHRQSEKSKLPDLLELSEDNEIYFNEQMDIGGNSNALTGMMSDADYFNMSGPSQASKSINSRRRQNGESVFGFSQNVGGQENRGKKNTELKNSYFDLSNFDVV